MEQLPSALPHSQIHSLWALTLADLAPLNFFKCNALMPPRSSSPLPAASPRYPSETTANVPESGLPRSETIRFLTFNFFTFY